MSRAKAVRPRPGTIQVGPGLADAIPPERPHRATTNGLGLKPGHHEEFLKKCTFVRELLTAQRIPACSAHDAAAWTLAFADEGDPTFPILEWLESGWTDPVLVSAALRICGTRELAESCMAQLDRDVASAYEHGIVLDLVRAMLTRGDVANDC